MGYLVVSKGQAHTLRRAFRFAEGLPARVSVGWPADQEPPAAVQLDASGDPVPTPGWATEAVDAPLEAGDLAALEVPDSVEKHLGTVVTVDGEPVEIPSADQLVDADDLPPELQAASRAR